MHIPTVLVRVAAVLAVTSGSAACMPTTVRADAYDRSCMTDDDCSVVTEGDVCASSCDAPCGNAAISRSDEDRFNAEAARRANLCLPERDPPETCVGRCTVTARCRSGTCQLDR